MASRWRAGDPGRPGRRRLPPRRTARRVRDPPRPRRSAPLSAADVLLVPAAHLLREVGDPDPVGRPASIPASIAAPRRRRARGRSTGPRCPPPRGVAEVGRRLLQQEDPVVLGVEEVHHLVRRTTLDEVRRTARPTTAAPAPEDRHRAGRRSAAGEDVSAASRITLSPRPPASTTPASRRTGSRSGRGPAPPGALGRRGEHVARPGVRPGHPLVGRVGRSADDGEDRALDRGADRGVARVRGPLHRLGQDLGVALVGTRLRDPATERPSISLRITPELPRAPSRAPRLSTARAVARSMSGSPPVASRTASRAADTVRYMFVPVSPSGTG